MILMNYSLLIKGRSMQSAFHYKRLRGVMGFARWVSCQAPEKYCPFHEIFCADTKLSIYFLAAIPALFAEIPDTVVAKQGLETIL